ncbi:acyltransferase [Nocardioides bigeumensis]|uniref:Acyltransferase n=1 Tax=Nocardioides bigeumensis TaxID=433657 RepID=A0ABN2YH63_9ACTN
MRASVPFAQVLSGGDNALNFLRLVLASGVVVGHAWPFVTGADGPMPGGMSLGVWCVSGFFGISGYLVTGSRMRLPFLDYLGRRALRILPAFWVCLVVTAVVFAPLSAMLAGDPVQIVDAGSAASYVGANGGLWIFQAGIDGTLTHVQIPGDWNGSLWTLSYEFAAYLAIGALFGLVRGEQGRRRVCLVLAGVLVVGNLLGEVRGVAAGVFVYTVWLGGAFLCGAVIRTWRDRVPCDARLAAGAAAVLVVACLLDLPRTLGAPALTYLLLWAGATLPIRLGRRHDVSYGIYIYAFPVSQLLGSSALDPHLGVPAQATLTFLLCLPLAWASWLLVESPAMRHHAALTRFHDRAATAPAERSQ